MGFAQMQCSEKLPSIFSGRAVTNSFQIASKTGLSNLVAH
jgi:hypothetical protein